jgi:hypothetical protein
MTAQMASDAKLDSKSISPGCTWFVHMATTAQIIAILKNTNPRPKIQKVPKPSPTQIQPAVTAEDFGTGGGIGSGGGFIYSARFSAGSIRTSMTEVFFMTYSFFPNFCGKGLSLRNHGRSVAVFCGKLPLSAQRCCCLVAFNKRRCRSDSP